MAEPTGCSSVAACAYKALESLVKTLPSAISCEFDHLPDESSHWPAMAVQTMQEDPQRRPSIDGGNATHCQVALALREAGDDTASRIEACELLLSIARELSKATAVNEGEGAEWHIEGHSQPYLVESTAGHSDYRVTLALSYWAHL